MANQELKLDVLDTRLTDKRTDWLCEWTRGRNPEYCLRVDEGTSLDRLLDDLLLKVKDDKIGLLQIFAHGLGVFEYADKAKKQLKAIHGGFGVELCKENLTMSTVERFGRLSGKFGAADVGIKLLGCAVAAAPKSVRETPGATPKIGFGRELCQRLANLTGAGVMASEALQDATIRDEPISFRTAGQIKSIEACVTLGDWEGTVWVFSPKGPAQKWKPAR